MHLVGKLRLGNLQIPLFWENCNKKSCYLSSSTPPPSSLLLWGRVDALQHHPHSFQFGCMKCRTSYIVTLNAGKLFFPICGRYNFVPWDLCWIIHCLKKTPLILFTDNTLCGSLCVLLCGFPENHWEQLRWDRGLWFLNRSRAYWGIQGFTHA